ncbi:unnamed protein product [Chrysodeixis includens]|uniref:Spaetzle domain-containing protein n=1 Tax=Chrysodeixis includens TaxID=689277 RepID=A0A9N8PZH5_CHRIL|nr:unnamed protein product [Chrysodeixis includens]
MFVGICFVFGALSLQLANGAPQNKNSDSSIVFPGPVQDVSRRYANNTNLPDKCKNQNYCTVKPDDYPQELFNQMFKGKYKEPIFQPTYVMTDDRQGDPEDMDDCESKVEFEQLFKVKSQAGEWFTVVQAPDEHFLQMVRIETCLNPGGSCFKEFEGPSEFQVICKQKYNAWEFLVQDGKSGTKKIHVELPVAVQMNLSTIQSKPYVDVLKFRTLSMPDSCAKEDATYCFERDAQYPTAAVENLLSKINKLSIDNSFYNERLGYESPDCPSNRTDKPIHYIIDDSDTVRAVIQAPQKFEQLYTVEKCIQEGKIKRDTSHFGLNTTLVEHDMECVNMRMKFDFVVLGESWQTLEIVQVKGGIPVCCRCRKMDKK